MLTSARCVEKHGTVRSLGAHSRTAGFLLTLLAVFGTGTHFVALGTDSVPTLSGEFAGANPRGRDGIVSESARRFLIRPSTEDPSRPRFNLTVAAQNPGSTPVDISLCIDWNESPQFQVDFMTYRQRLAVGKDDSWTWYEASSVKGPMACFNVRLPGGQSYIALNPKYTSVDLDRFLASLPVKPYQVLDHGRTAEDRPIKVLKFSQPGGGSGARRAVLVTARVHPDETAGSYAAEGAIRFLCDAGGGSLLTNFDVYVVPMANPDGVENGLCKLTGVKGIDLPRDAVVSTDPTGKALMRLVNEISPAAYLDLHQWWLKRDWILSFVPEPEWTARLFVNLERLQSFDRGWQITTQKEVNEAAPDLRGYCFKRWATQAVSLSLVWGHIGAKPRTTSEMRSIGESALKGFCAALK